MLVEFIDVGTVLVGDPEEAVLVEDETLSVDRDPLPSIACATEAIASVCGCGERREAAVRDRVRGVCVEACGGLAIRTGQKNGVEVLQL